MTTLLIRRLLRFPLVVSAVYVITFALVAAAPGDPLIGADSKVPPVVRRQQEKLYRLDRPWPVQCWDYVARGVGGLWRGRLELGRSISYQGRPVAEVLGLTAETWRGGAMRVSLSLGSTALALAVTLGLTLGVLSADRPNGVLDHASMALAVFGVSLPTFVTGSLLILVFSISLGWLPVGGWGRPSNIILPAITLSMPFTAYIARLTRSAMLDELRGDYIRTARAKGLSRGEVLFSHAFRVAVLPVLGYIGPAAASILVGSFVVEKLFAAPGVGRYFVEAVLRRDYPLIIATVLVYSVMLVGFNLLADVAVLLADPRIARRGIS